MNDDIMGGVNIILASKSLCDCDIEYTLSTLEAHTISILVAILMNLVAISKNLYKGKTLI